MKTIKKTDNSNSTKINTFIGEKVENVINEWYTELIKKNNMSKKELEPINKKTNT